MIVVAGAVVLLAGCGQSRSGSPAAGGGSATSGGSAPGAATARVPRSSAHVVLFLGTSLTAGLGLDPDAAFPALIQRRLDSLHLRWRAVNAGVSGETSAGALRRLDWLLKEPVAILVVETGANDGLRGLDVDSTRANLLGVVRRARAAQPGIRILLAGMEAPPNLGARYTARFRAAFRGVAAREHLALIPFLLAGVGGVDSLNQRDGIHPNAAGERLVARNVWRVLEPLVRGGAAP